MHKSLNARIIFGVLLAGSATASEVRVPRTSVAGILSRSETLDGATVEVRGRVVGTRELSYFEDGSNCRKTKVCKLWVEFDECVVSGGRYSGLGCGEAMNRMRANEHNFEFSLPQIIGDVVLRGVLSTKRKDLTVDKSARHVPRPGFGHLGIYPAQITVTLMQMDATQ